MSRSARAILLATVCILLLPSAPFAQPAANDPDAVVELFRQRAQEVTKRIRASAKQDLATVREDLSADLQNFARFHPDPGDAAIGITFGVQRLLDATLRFQLEDLSAFGSTLLQGHSIGVTPRPLQAGALRGEWATARSEARRAFETFRAGAQEMGRASLARIEAASPGFHANLELGGPIEFDWVGPPRLANDPVDDLVAPPVVVHLVSWSGPGGSGIYGVVRGPYNLPADLVLRIVGPDGFDQSRDLDTPYGAAAFQISEKPPAVSDVVSMPIAPAPGMWRVTVRYADESRPADALSINVP